MVAREPARRYPVVRPPFIPIVVDQDTIEFRCGPWAGPVYTIQDQDGDGHLGKLVQLVDGGHSVSEILGEFAPSERDEVADVLERLREEDVLIESEETPGEQAGGYISLNQLSGREEIDGLADASVLIVNENPIGRTILHDLARIGVESLKLYGFDGNEQDARWSDVPVREVMEWKDERDLAEVIDAVDCVVYTEEKPHPDRLDTVNETAFTMETPWIPGRLLGLDGIVGPAIRPGLTSCFECFRTRARGTLDGEAAFRELGTAAGSSTRTVMEPAFARVVAGYLTLDVINLLVSNMAFTVDRCIHFDFFSFNVEANAVLRAPRCAVCGRPDTLRVDRQRFLTLSQLVGDDPK